MALTLSEIQAVTNDVCDRIPHDIYFSDNVLLWKLMGKGGFEANMVEPGETVDGGEYIRVILEYAAAHTGSYGAETTIAQSRKDIFNAARFRWSGYYASNAIDLNDRIKNSGESAFIDLITGKLANIRKSIRDKMGTDAYASAADSFSMLGLGNMFSTSTSTTYGGIAEDDMSMWKANSAGTSGSINFAIMQLIRRTAQNGQNASDKPDLYIMTQLLLDAFENTLQVQARYSDKEMVDAGFANILFGGAPCVADDKQTTGYCDGLNTRYLKVKTHKDFAFTMPKWEYDKEQPDNLVANTRWIGQLVCSNRKAHARHTGLTA